MRRGWNERRSLGLLLAVLLCGCSSRADDLVGTWVSPGIPGVLSPTHVILSPDGTGRVLNDRLRNLQVTWRRLDQQRFTLAQVDGETWPGCLADDAIIVRVRYDRNERPRLFRYQRARTWHGRTIPPERADSSQGLPCIP